MGVRLQEIAARGESGGKNMTPTLDQLSPGGKARVKRISGQGAVRRRLMDMGLVGGVEIELIKAAPMGDPLEFLLRGYHLSLRKSEAQMVELHP
jgi:ferrous iron transport protein A